MGIRASRINRKRSSEQIESNSVTSNERRTRSERVFQEEEEEEENTGTYLPPEVSATMSQEPAPPPSVIPNAAVRNTGLTNALNNDPPPLYTYTDHRPNEGWSPKLVSEARKLRDDCNQASGDHDQAGYGHRTRHIIFGLPGPLVAVLVGGIAGLWESEDARFLITPLSMFGGIMTAVHIFLNMAGRAERHWAYAAHYGGLASEIHHELQRDPRRRRESDEFFAEILTRIGHLNANAPQLPNKKKKGCKSACCGTGAYGGVNIIVEGGEDDDARQELAEILGRLREQDRQRRTNETTDVAAA